MESTQRSPGLRTRTRGARLDNGLNLFGAGMNLGPLRLPPAAARVGQIRWSFFPHIAPLVCLAFSASVASFLVSPGRIGNGRALALRNCSNEPNGAPTKAQRQRVLWGEDEQGSAARNAHPWAFRVECTLRGQCRARRPGAPRRRNNAPSSVIAYGDATFPPG